MIKSSPVTQKIFMWTYERGTLQYDIICALILAFIFFVPPSCFHKRQFAQTKSVKQPSQISQPAGSVKEQGGSPHEKK
jgi:hypothetical protein